MQVEAELAEVSPKKDMLLTIGVFDGVHLGHKYLLSKLKEQADKRRLLSGVVTFHQHPRAVLGNRPELPYLTSLDEKVALIKNEGIDTVITLSFSKELSRLSAREFVALLKKHLRMQGLVLGADFMLGQNREGDIARLSKLGQEMGFSVEAVPQATAGEQVVSSTVIRDALAKGSIKKVTGMFGRPFSLHGNVMRGAGRGKTLGFPTANIEVDPQQLLPPDGVYATIACLGCKTYLSLTNVGKNPTFGANRRTVEVYLLDFEGNIYGHELRIDFIERLRGERKFSSVEELKKQMAADVEQGRAALRTITAK